VTTARDPATARAPADLPGHGPERSAQAWRQTTVAVLVGVLAGWGAHAGAHLQPTESALVGWDVAVVVHLSWLWAASWGLDSEATAEAALREDPTRLVSDGLLLVAALACLAAVVSTIGRAASSSGGGETARVLLGVGSITCSWFLVHSLFTVRYARAYFQGPDGGIDFNADEPPVWTDFAYLAFTVGMTYQVSDTALRTHALRRLALRHMLVAYLFGAVVIAVTIQLVAGLGH
jgi:uncharacterized membrane protein